MRRFIGVITIMLISTTSLFAQAPEGLDLGLWGIWNDYGDDMPPYTVDADNCYNDGTDTSNDGDNAYAACRDQENLTEELRLIDSLNANVVMEDIPGNYQQEVIDSAYKKYDIRTTVRYNPSFSNPKKGDNSDNEHYSPHDYTHTHKPVINEDNCCNKEDTVVTSTDSTELSALVDTTVTQFEDDHKSGLSYYYVAKEQVLGVPDTDDDTSTEDEVALGQWRAVEYYLDEFEKQDQDALTIAHDLVSWYGEGNSDYYCEGCAYNDKHESLSIREFADKYMDKLDVFVGYVYPFHEDDVNRTQESSINKKLVNALKNIQHGFANNSTDWHWIIQTQNEIGGGTRRPTMSELRVQAYLALAFGAQGIHSYIYSSGVKDDPDKFYGFYSDYEVYGLIDETRRPFSKEYDNPDTHDTEKNIYAFDNVKRLYAELDSLSPTITDINFDDHFIHTDVPLNIANIQSVSITDDTADISTFSDLGSSNSYFLVMNRSVEDYDDPTAEVVIKGDKTIRRVSSDTRIYSGYNSSSNSTTFEISLKPGEGKLFQVEDAPLNNTGDKVYTAHSKIHVQDTMDFKADTVVLRSKHSLTIGPAVKIEMGAGSATRFVVNGGLDVNGSLTSDRDSLARFDFGNAIILNSDGNTLTGFQVHEVYRGITVKSQNNYFEDCLITANGKYGITSGYTSAGNKSSFKIVNCKIDTDQTGFELYHAEVNKSKYITVEWHGDYAVWLSDTEWYKTQKSVFENNDTNGGNAAIYITDDSRFNFTNADHSNYNRLANNGSHEVFTASSGWKFRATITTYGGDNSIYDSDDDAGSFDGEYYIYNNSDYVQDADEVWWENEDPKSGHFIGEVSTNNPIYQSSDPSSGSGFQGSSGSSSERAPQGHDELVAAAQGSKNPSSQRSLDGLTKEDTDLKDRIIDVRQKLKDHPYSDKTFRRLNRLFSLQRLDQDNSLNERAETREVFANWRDRLEKLVTGKKDYTAEQEKVIRKTGEKAVIIGVTYAQQLQEYNTAESILTVYKSYVKTKENRRTLLLRRIDRAERLRQFDQALTLLDKAHQIKLDSVRAQFDQHYKQLKDHIKYMRSIAQTEESAAKQTVNREVANRKPDKFKLRNNYPNPFNPTTTIKYAVPRQVHVTLEVYNIMGRRVATLVDKTKKAGRYTVRFDASNLASGLYLYKLTTPQKQFTRKMMLIK